jgi:hypothetical protein
MWERTAVESPIDIALGVEGQVGFLTTRTEHLDSARLLAVVETHWEELLFVTKDSLTLPEFSLEELAVDLSETLKVRMITMLT